MKRAADVNVVRRAINIGRRIPGKPTGTCERCTGKKEERESVANEIFNGAFRIKRWRERKNSTVMQDAGDAGACNYRSEAS